MVYATLDKCSALAPHKRNKFPCSKVLTDIEGRLQDQVGKDLSVAFHSQGRFLKKIQFHQSCKVATSTLKPEK